MEHLSRKLIVHSVTLVKSDDRMLKDKFEESQNIYQYSSKITRFCLRQVMIFYDQKSVRILPFNIAAMEYSMLPVDNKTIPIIAVPMVINNLFVSRTLT